MYRGLALEDNLEVGEAVGVDVVFPASAPVPSNSQPKKQTHSLQWVLLGEDMVISPTCEVEELPVQFLEGPIAKGPGWDTCSRFLRPTLVP